MWKAVVDVDFREVEDRAEADIRIGMSGDSARGLGTSGGTLGYTVTWWDTAFARALASAIVMDSAEPWTDTHFFNVMLHEIGHALGLDHSMVADSVMYAFYSWSGTTTRSSLHQDDISGINAVFSPISLGNLTRLPGPVSLGRTMDGSLDYFRFTLSASRTMRFELRDLTANANLYLEDSSGTVLARSELAGTEVDAIVRQLGAGTYYVRVDAYAGGAGAIGYQLYLGNPPGDGWTRSSASDLGDLTGLASAREFADTVNRDDNDQDYRRFTLTASRTMRFELRGLTADADLYLEDSSGTVLAQSALAGTADDTIVQALDAGTYYVRVDAYAAGGIDYRLRIGREAGSPPAGRTRRTAHDLGDLTGLLASGSPRAFSGTVDRDGGDDDYRRFTLTASRTMRFELRDLTADADLYLEDSAGTVLARSIRSGTADDAIVRTLGAGTYYVRVDAYAAGGIDYQLRLRREAGSPPPDGRTRQTAHDLGDLTGLLASGSPRAFPGTVNRDGNDDDYRRFTLTASRTMRFELRDLTADADLYLEDSSGTVLARSALGGTATDTIVQALDAGTYYVRVDAYAAGSIDYRLRIGREAGSSLPVAASRSLAPRSRRLWRDRDMAAGRNLRPSEADRFQEESGILTA